MIMTRQKAILFLAIGCIAVAQQPANEAPSPIPRPTLENSDRSRVTQHQLDYFSMGMEYAALELCGLDPYAKTDVVGIQPSYCLVGQHIGIPDLTFLNPNETYDHTNTNWTSASVYFSLRAIYTGLYQRGILPEAIRDWVSKEPLALLGIANLPENDKRVIGEILERERDANANRTTATVAASSTTAGTRTSSLGAEVTAQMEALEKWNIHRRSDVTAYSGTVVVTPTPTFALGDRDKEDVFMVLSSALPQVFGKLDKPRTDAEKGADPKNGAIVETRVKSPFVGGGDGRTLWFDAIRTRELSGASGLGRLEDWGWWAAIWGVAVFVTVL
ncbi:hypothetical protein QBC40DRAFT_270963 [Triangularia verruculosa]|uniref:Uncharacterized protein n=1 Tax=Triangularia verruculosa TaxID=2587418 RepID=A0AAN6XRW9_9PEZI|nr:hypothetical protein QBC40DRAFT_270963 [Triangularia verruculosa]